MRRVRVAAVLAGLLAGLALAAPAAAFTAPELFVRLQPWETHAAVGDWIPLASAPSLNYVGGYQLGYRLQASGQPNEFQRVALTVAAVPDGRPTQPAAVPPYCVGRAGAVGTIVEAGPELQFEGTGTYTVTVSVGPGSEGSTDCLSGPSTTASFTVAVSVAPTRVGDPLSFRAVALRGDPFVGVSAPVPPGGQADVRCALNGKLQPDGGVAGSSVVPDADNPLEAIHESFFPRPGVWTCVARGTAEGRNESLDRTAFATPWSPPLTVDVRSDFRRRTGTVSGPRSQRPRFTFTAEWPGEANGGRAGVTLFRVTGCTGTRFKLRRIATYRGRFDARRMRITIRRPRVTGFYIGRFSFSGTRFLRASLDPNAMRLLAVPKYVGFAEARDFPHCPGYRP